MQTLRKLLYGWFLPCAVVFGVSAVLMVPFQFENFLHPERRMPLAFDAGGLSFALSASIGVLFFSLPVFTATAYGLAWWKLRRGRSSGRLWALVASLSMVIPLAAFIATSMYSRYPAPAAIWVVFAFGILTFVAFLPRKASITVIDVTKAKPVRIAGDGTHKIIDVLAGVFVVVSVWIGDFVFEKWALGHRLPSTSWLQFSIAILTAIFVSTLFHECGHAVVGVLLGMKLYIFVVGPFQWRVRDGQWKFHFKPNDFLGAGGLTGLIPVNPHQPASVDITMIAAGPAASLLTGLVALLSLLAIPGGPLERFWQFFAFLAVISLSSVVVNLLPILGKSFYSDGAQIYQLLRGGPWADLRRVNSLITSSLATPIRPRDYDIEAIHRLSDHFKTGRQAMLLRLFGTSYYMETNQLNKARQTYLESETLARDIDSHLPAEVLTAFVFRSAALMQDAGAAQEWWEKMEARKPQHLGVDYWLARTALFWVRNESTEVEKSLAKASECAQKLPHFGAYEFDRFRLEFLRHVMKNSPEPFIAVAARQVADSVSATA